jgi:hypothetical protein
MRPSQPLAGTEATASVPQRGGPLGSEVGDVGVALLVGVVHRGRCFVSVGDHPAQDPGHALGVEGEVRDHVRTAPARKQRRGLPVVAVEGVDGACEPLGGVAEEVGGVRGSRGHGAI